MKIFWFSFSYKGKNNGVCVVKADTEEDGFEKIENLQLLPDYDDVHCTECENIDNDPGIEFNVLYSPEEMVQKGYIPVITKL